MPKRYCPICKLIPLLRPEVKTCGAKECQTGWRLLSPEQRARSIANEDIVIDLEFLKPKSDGSLPSIEEAMEAQQKAEAIGRGEGFLDSVFGNKKKEGE